MILWLKRQLKSPIATFIDEQTALRTSTSLGCVLRGSLRGPFLPSLDGSPKGPIKRVRRWQLVLMCKHIPGGEGNGRDAPVSIFWPAIENPTEDI